MSGRIFRDTTQFMDIGPGDALELGGRIYEVKRDAVSRGFAYEDVKFWVKRCVGREDGKPYIIKLEFHENFELSLGGLKVRCFRSPLKESRVLDAVRGDKRFMQGQTVADSAGNLARIVEVVRGYRLDLAAFGSTLTHEEYYHLEFKGYLQKFLQGCQAIARLHGLGLTHGDICGEHLLVDYKSGGISWIDFDYAYESFENPFGLDVFGLGDILIFLAGKGYHNQVSLAENGGGAGADDFSLLYPNRLANLACVFPYIEPRLAQVMRHFCAASEVAYESVDELVEELGACL